MDDRVCCISTIDCKHYFFILPLAPGSFLETTEALRTIRIWFLPMTSLDPPTQNRAIQAMNRHIFAATHMDQPLPQCPIVEFRPSCVASILLLIFQPTHPSILMLKRLINLLRLYVEDSDSLVSYIMRKRRGASVGLNGFSNDQNQDILRHDPDAIHHLTSICNLIATGIPTDGAARKLLLK
jgi:hypothetical protein